MIGFMQHNAEKAKPELPLTELLKAAPGKKPGIEGSIHQRAGLPISDTPVGDVHLTDAGRSEAINLPEGGSWTPRWR